jgi:hypothetical protein
MIAQKLRKGFVENDEEMGREERVITYYGNKIKKQAKLYSPSK